MENYSINSDSELLYMTLDGEADEIQSSILFRKLAVDAELQKEFRDAVSINHGAVKESENIVPSGKLTNNIFSTLNIGTATAPAITEKSIPGINKLTQFLFNRWPVAIISGIVCSLLTYFMLGNNSLQDRLPIKVYTYTANTATNNADNNTGSNNTVAGKTQQINNPGGAKTVRSTTANSDNKNFQNSSMAQKDDSENTLSKVPTLIPIQIIRTENLSYVASEINSGSIFFSIIPTELSGSSLIDRNDNGDEDIDEFPYFLSIGAFNQNALKFYPDRDLNIGNEPLFNNSGLNISWLIDESNSIGIEYSQETLPMYIGGDAITDPYYPRKSLVFFGINYTHIFNSLEIINNLRPYLKNSVSGCKIGMSFKPEAGLIWNPADRVQVFLAADGNILLYRNNLDVFKTIKKVGLRYGINLLF